MQFSVLGRGAMPEVILVGASGAGRTSVGQSLAKVLGRSFVETEDLLETPLDDLLYEDPIHAKAHIISVARRQLVMPGIMSLLPSAAAEPSLLGAIASQSIVLVHLEAPIAELAKRSNLNAPRTAALGTPRALFAAQVRALTEAVKNAGAVSFSTENQKPEVVAAKIVSRFALQ